MKDFIIKGEAWLAIKTVLIGEYPAQTVSREGMEITPDGEQELLLGWDKNGNAIELYEHRGYLQIEWCDSDGLHNVSYDKDDLLSLVGFAKAVEQALQAIHEPSEWRAILERG